MFCRIRIKHYAAVWMASVLFCLSPALAGSHLLTDTGHPYRWDLSQGPVPYTVDSGPLGPLGDEKAQEFVREAFRTWQAVTTATISFRFDGTLPEDVNGTNALLYLDVPEEGLNPVVFDDDGTIIDLMLGSQANRSHLGITRQHLSRDGWIVNAEIVLNGRLVSTGIQGQQGILADIVHEIGHFIGLGHSQLNHQFWEDGDPSNNVYLPTMFPIQSEDDSSLSDLHLDDQCAVSSLYPSDSFWSSTGGVVGLITRRSGGPVQGASVIARNSQDPYRIAASGISDCRLRGTGEFEIFGLPHGEYLIHVEPIDPRFHGTAAVGPFAQGVDSESFVNPITPEYYNGPRESGASKEDLPEDYELVAVELGEAADVEIVANEEEAAVEAWGLHNP